MISERKCWFMFDLHHDVFGERLFGFDVRRVFLYHCYSGDKICSDAWSENVRTCFTFISSVDKRKTCHVVSLQYLTRILPETVICSSHPINHTAWRCCLPQTISNLKTWRPWLLFTGPVNIQDKFIPHIRARDGCNVIIFEASTSVCLGLTNHAQNVSYSAPIYL